MIWSFPYVRIMATRQDNPSLAPVAPSVIIISNLIGSREELREIMKNIESKLISDRASKYIRIIKKWE